MKRLFVVLTITVALRAQSAAPITEAPKPPDAAIAAYFKADAALAASKANHEAMMDNIRKALSESITNQARALVTAQAALVALDAACAAGHQLDLTALQNGGDVKCIERKK